VGSPISAIFPFVSMIDSPVLTLMRDRNWSCILAFQNAHRQSVMTLRVR
jgi:hypothetical protein